MKTRSVRAVLLLVLLPAGCGGQPPPGELGCHLEVDEPVIDVGSVPYGGMAAPPGVGVRDSCGQALLLDVGEQTTGVALLPSGDGSGGMQVVIPAGETFVLEPTVQVVGVGPFTLRCSLYARVVEPEGEEARGAGRPPAAVVLVGEGTPH